MRRPLVVGLTVLVSAAAVGAETPIPQDAVRMEKRRRERLEWNRRTLRGAYDKVGKKDPRWDEPAREAMDLAARMFSEQVDPEVTLRRRPQAGQGRRRRRLRRPAPGLSLQPIPRSGRTIPARRR